MHNYLKLLIITIFVTSLVGFKSVVKKESGLSEKKVFFQDTLTWGLLSKIDYVKKPDDLYGEVMFPIINQKLKSLQGKPIVISGFIIPIDSKNYAISKNVFAACFFCGKSGPETIMGIKFKGDLPKLKTDQYVTLKGTFRYNDNDVEDWIYHVENAVITAGK